MTPFAETLESETHKPTHLGILDDFKTCTGDLTSKGDCARRSEYNLSWPIYEHHPAQVEAQDVDDLQPSGDSLVPADPLRNSARNDDLFWTSIYRWNMDRCLCSSRTDRSPSDLGGKGQSHFCRIRSMSFQLGRGSSLRYTRNVL